MEQENETGSDGIVFCRDRECELHSINSVLKCCCVVWWSIDMVASAVLSGNRNFEGRVHPLTRANYLASPPLVVAYAFAGTVGRRNL